MIQLEIGNDVGGYMGSCIANVTNWPLWPVRAKLTLKMERFIIPLKVALEY